MVFICIFAILFLILYSGMLALAIWNLLDAWRTGRAEDWRDFWDNVRHTPTLLYPVLIFSIPGIWRLTFESVRRVIEARQAAVAGDELRAPVSQQQPATTEGDDLISSLRFGPLRATNLTPRAPVLVAAIFLLIFGVFTGLLGFALLAFIPIDASNTILQITGWFVVGLGILTLTGSALLLYRFYRLTRPLIIEADDWGLRWRQPEKRRVSKSIPWHEAQAFVLLRHHVGTEYARESAFALVGRETTLAWLVKPTEVYGAHKRLAGLIVARTKLPLRDITGDVEAAQGAQGADPMTALETKVTTERKHAELAAHLALSQSPHEPQRIEEPVTPPAPPTAPGAEGSVRASTGCLIVLAVLLLPLAPQGVGWGLQQYQSRYYSDLVSQVHAQQPVFEDRLAYDDGRWPVAEEDQFHQSWFYQDGAYHVRGADPAQTITAPGPESYGDVVVEVTATQVNAGQRRDLYDGVGLLLRASESKTDFVAFLVTPAGEWSLWRFHDVGDETRNWNELSYGQSDAIHWGVGEQNRLIVMLHGARYLCYVNDQFVGVVQDDGPALPQGRMGVFVNESTTEGMFSDFTVYPTPALDSLPFT
jgi:hypothetical protein